MGLCSTIILMVLGSVSKPDERLSLFFLPSVQIVTWSELFIIRHIYLLFIIGVSSIFFGISSFLLFFWKIFLKYDNVEENVEDESKYYDVEDENIYDEIEEQNKYVDFDEEEENYGN